MAPKVRFGAFELDPHRRVLRKDGLRIRVPGQSLEILAALVATPGEPLGRERIQQLLWPHGTVVGFDQSINAAVKRLREALGDTARNPRFVERVPGRGYRFIAPVEVLEPATPDPGLNVAGAAVLHYSLIEEAGRGAMGEVWKAKDTRLDRVVALKFVPAPAAGAARSLDALRAEARHAAALNHPNICTIHGLEEQGGRRFLVMEYVAGGPLSRALAGGPLPASRVVAIGVQAASALAAAHAAGIVHRDLKPANFLLTPDGCLKLTDFGIAKAIRDVARATGGRPSPTGTLEYLSPEQAAGDPLDPRSDLFSLGVVLYELATGQLPFSGETPAAVLDAVLHRAPAAPRTLNPRLPRGLEQVILRALEKDPELRWPSASAMLEALQEVERAQEAGRSRRRWVRGGLTVAAAAALAAAGWRAWTRRGEVATARDLVVVAEFDNATGETVFDGALRQAVLSQLGESRRIEVASAERVRAALARSGRPPDEPLSRGVVRDVCQRLGGKAVVAGSIRSVGSRYFVGLEATGCTDGESLGSAYGEAAAKEHVLERLAAAVTQLRGRLGESLAAIREVSAPAEATTRSLEALRAYSLALTAKTRGDDALPLLRRALELDPDFPLAWLSLAQAHFNRGQESKAEQAISRAYELRGRTSERERLMIEAVYHQLASGDYERAIAAGTLAAQLYPADPGARRAAFVPYCMAGELGPAREIARRELALAPEEGVTYFNLAILHLADGRTAEAGAVLDQAATRGVASDWFPFARQLATVLGGDPEAVERTTEPAAGRPLDARTAALQAQTAGYLGQLSRAAEVAQVAEAHEETREVAATVHATVAVAEALFGRQREARTRARRALRLASGRRTETNAAFALALAGEPEMAEAALADLLRRYPQDNGLERSWAPAVRGAIALVRGDARAAMAATMGPGERAAPWVVYVRARADMELGRPSEAAAEFRALLAARSALFANAAFYGAAAAYPTARVGLARALVRAGQAQAAREQYEAFLALWSRADPDVPLLLEARREHAALVRAAEEPARSR
jgi:DNA-binding winged helix-turn-helix (wHTH) protein/tetratricopeptide (TPR) repeat protein